MSFARWLARGLAAGALLAPLAAKADCKMIELAGFTSIRRAARRWSMAR
jgi:hypothetical protein